MAHPASPAAELDSWSAGPTRPRLRPRAVHLWRADLDTVEESLCALLSAHELARGEQIVGRSQRIRWLRSRAVLRALLGRYLRCDPRALRLALGAHGKPALAHQPGPVAARLEFNLSHSRHLALYAFAACEPIGVDVEIARPGFDPLAVAARVLGAAAALQLAALDRRPRELAFARLWARREAGVKLLGSDIRAAGAHCAAPWILDVALEPHAAAALATPEQPAELERWQWGTGGREERDDDG